MRCTYCDGGMPGQSAHCPYCVARRLEAALVDACKRLVDAGLEDTLQLMDMGSLSEAAWGTVQAYMEDRARANEPSVTEDDHIAAETA